VPTNTTEVFGGRRGGGEAKTSGNVQELKAIYRVFSGEDKIANRSTD